MTVDAVVVGSHVVAPGGIVERNIVVDDGRIAGLTTDVPACDRRVRADGLVSLPGVIDPHVHYGVYTPIERAAVTESRAAAIGGVTTMMRMLRLGGSYREGLGAHLRASAGSHYVDYSAHASIFDAGQASEMEFCAASGAPSFKLYMNLGGEIGHVYMDMPPGSSELAEARVEVGAETVGAVVRNAAALGLPVLVHAEDYESCSCGMREAREGRRDGLGAWSDSRSPEYEAKAISEVSALARLHGCTLYFVHVGSARALEQVRAERRAGTRILVETCPHYLVLSHEGRAGYRAKVMPPIRTRRDNEAVWAALAAGEIDTVGTDHVANRLDLKLAGGDVWGALAGFPGIGTLLPILASEGVGRGRVSYERLASLTSAAAARIFSMGPAKGSLGPGSDADITVLDPRLERAVSADMFGGHSDYTVYEGLRLRGWPVKTMVRGAMVAEDFEVVGRVGHGRLVRREAGRGAAGALAAAR